VSIAADDRAAAHPYDALTPDAVIDAVESAGWRCDARLLALNSYENRVYQVGIEDSEPLIAKFYRPGRWSAAQIQEEHDFSSELANAEIPVVAPLRDATGHSLHRHAGMLFALFPRRGGYPPELDNPDHLLVLGRTLGRMHTLGASRPFAHRPQLDIAAVIADSRAVVQDDFVPGDLGAAYTSLLDDIQRELAPIAAEISGGDLIRLHGDCHVGNILWRDDTPHFVDLDDCLQAPAIQDLWMFLSGERHDQELQLAELVEGYSEFADFPARQLRWVEALRTMRIVRYAAWLARRWDDPAFPRAFPWFAGGRFWSDHILELREQFARLQEPPLRLL
jgi:Ser/Thr protein kinase RdoA (MazF antagonist)